MNNIPMERIVDNHPRITNDVDHHGKIEWHGQLATDHSLAKLGVDLHREENWRTPRKTLEARMNGRDQLQQLYSHEFRTF